MCEIAAGLPLRSCHEALVRSVFGFLIMSCESQPEIRSHAHWSLFMLALVPLTLACYFFV